MPRTVTQAALDAAMKGTDVNVMMNSAIANMQNPVLFFPEVEAPNFLEILPPSFQPKKAMPWAANIKLASLPDSVSSSSGNSVEVLSVPEAGLKSKKREHKFAFSILLFLSALLSFVSFLSLLCLFFFVFVYCLSVTKMRALPISLRVQSRGRER